ncbi:MAG: response regulator [Spirochaetia bacterium]|nr:response regulator [Spirochaetia bacterium]
MRNAKILIVEDEFIIAERMKMTLEKNGYIILDCVPYAEEAVEKAKELLPDIILMDIKLEGEMNGVEAANVIISRFGIPVIFLSAYLEYAYLEKVNLKQPYGYLAKPVKDNDLLITIEMALYGRKVESRRKQLEKKLEKAKKRLQKEIVKRKSKEAEQRLILNVPDALVLFTKQDNTIIYTGIGWKSLFGYTPDEMIGKSFYQFIHPEDTPELDNEKKIIYQNEFQQYFKNRYRRKNGTYVSLSWRANYDHETGYSCLIAEGVTDYNAVEKDRGYALEGMLNYSPQNGSDAISSMSSLRYCSEKKGQFAPKNILSRNKKTLLKSESEQKSRGKL